MLHSRATVALRVSFCRNFAAFACAAGVATAQSGLAGDTYYANDGRSGRAEPELAEFAPDLGGLIPFARFDATDPVDGHVLARRWDANAAGRTFRGELLADFGDLRRLDRMMQRYMSGAPSLLPFRAGEAVLEQAPVDRATWWGLPMRLWPYRLHGGPVLIAMRDLTQFAPPDPIHLMLVNFSSHPSDFATNRNRTDSVFNGPEAGWSGPPGSPILGPTEQALARGDAVVFVMENQSDDAWVALQRTQEAETFVRDQFLATIGITPDPATSRSFLHGGSWGGIISTFLALLQPHVYAGSTGYTADDWSYGFGDYRLLSSFHQAAMGMLAPQGPSDPAYMQFFALVDLLGIRFDAPQSLAGGGAMQPWDLAAFSVNRRPGDLKVPITGFIADEDFTIDGHWSAQNAALNPTFQPRLRRNMEHGAAYGVLPGANEYALFTGHEWADMIASGATVARNVDLVPTVPLPSGQPAYPDPYRHTLLHQHVALPNEDFLSEVDLSAAHGGAAQVKSIGQGCWPAIDDALFVGDADGDGGVELVFGNLDGRVHVLELDPSRDPNDPLRLWDEWRSPYLGREITALAWSGRGAGTRFFAGDGLGRIWRIEQGANGFEASAAPIATPASAPGALADGPIPMLFTGDFARQHAGKELLVLNRWLDWSLLSEQGQAIAGGVLRRSLHAMGPAGGAVADVDGDGDDELLVACRGGDLWCIDPAPDGRMDASTGNPRRLLATPGRALYKVEPCYFHGSSRPSHVLLLARDDNRVATDPTLSPNLVLLYDLTTKTEVAEVEARQDDSLSTSSFTWITEPKAGKGTARFALSGPTTVQSFTVRLVGAGTAGGASITPELQNQLVEQDEQSFRPNQIDALGTARVGGKAYVVAALGNGRFFVLDRHLQYARTSDSEYAGDPQITGVNPAQPWPSNRTLARTYARDLYQDAPGGDAHLVFADYAQLFLRGPKRYRLGDLKIPASGPAVWDPYVDAAPNGAGHPLKADLTRALRYVDTDGDGIREPHAYSEAGDLYLDPVSGKWREFCDGAWDPPFFRIADPSKKKLLGGHVFEIVDLATSDYRYLSDFFLPRDPSQAQEDFGGNDWWYPQVGANRLSGQIACYSQGVLPVALGSSMKVVNLPDPSGTTSQGAWDVVVGTNGGYVYAITPGPVTAGPNQPSTLSYASQDLGAYVLALDAGNLDGDADQEIVAGTWLDTGSYPDWVQGDRTKNRAHLLILDPQPAQSGGPGSFAVTELDGDDLCGPGEGIGSGVGGVRVDDVDGDGVNEIWCGDASHVWLFFQHNGAWECFFRSPDLGAYLGIYGSLHPVKDAAGHTVRLVVGSSGYTFAFDVDWPRLAAAH